MILLSCSHEERIKSSHLNDAQSWEVELITQLEAKLEWKNHCCIHSFKRFTLCFSRTGSTLSESRWSGLREARISSFSSNHEMVSFIAASKLSRSSCSCWKCSIRLSNVDRRSENSSLMVSTCEKTTFISAGRQSTAICCAWSSATFTSGWRDINFSWSSFWN